jgi:SRSO17 transposase
MGKQRADDDLREWLRPFLEVLGDKRRRRWPEIYLNGLIAPLTRKSIQPIAELAAPGDQEQVHHFVSASPWECAPLERVLARKANELLGGEDAVLVVDTTSLLKFGRHSVGVARQYSGQAGKLTNCQTLVSLTLAKNEVGVLVGLRLYVPPEWANDPVRCTRAGIPEVFRSAPSRIAIATQELDRVLHDGLKVGVVLADAGYGKSAEFRRFLSNRGLMWAVGVAANQIIYNTTASATLPPPKSTGRPLKRLIATEERHAVADYIAALPDRSWRQLTWRMGTKGPRKGKFVALRVRVGDGAMDSRGRHLPGDEAWLVAEQKSSGEIKYYLSNLPTDTSLLQLVRVRGIVRRHTWRKCLGADHEQTPRLGL